MLKLELWKVQEPAKARATPKWQNIAYFCHQTLFFSFLLVLNGQTKISYNYFQILYFLSAVWPMGNQFWNESDIYMNKINITLPDKILKLLNFVNDSNLREPWL